jgi:hypothetical protein
MMKHGWALGLFEDMANEQVARTLIQFGAGFKIRSSASAMLARVN